MEVAAYTLPEIKTALENDQMVYFYQPKISLITGKPSGAEALLRWIKPDGTIIPPGLFVPLAEETGFIKTIAYTMFPKLIADLSAIHEINNALTVSFNLTAQDFETPEITELISNAISRRQVDPQRLQIELTEASIIDSGKPIVREHLQTLVDIGVSLAMDDFGTGYSSIDTLSLWPFSVVKLDRGLINRMNDCPKCTSIVQSSIRMAHMLGISIIAEGIETSEIFDFLMQAGCTEAQGFWMARPLPLAEYLTFVRKDRRWSGFPVGMIHIVQLDHIHWRRMLIDQVIGYSHGEPDANSVKKFTAELDHTKCKLGHWYYGHGQEFKGLSFFDKLEAPHRRLHEIGKEIIETVRRDAPHNEIADLLSALTKESSTLLELLQELENQAIF